MPDLAAAMRAAVRGLVDRLDTEQRRQLVFRFDGDMHKRWTYLPGQRPGLRLSDLSEEQLEPALALPYWLVVLGDPTSTDPWGWRINGHQPLAQAAGVRAQVYRVTRMF